VAVYQRQHWQPAGTVVPLQPGADLSGVVGSIEGSHAALTSGGLTVAGRCVLSFARPVVAVGLIVAPGGAPSGGLRAIARHQSGAVDEYPSARHPRSRPPGSGPWFVLSGDEIDALEIDASGHVVVETLSVVMLLDTLDLGQPGQAPPWELLGSANLDPASTASTSQTGIIANPPPDAATAQVRPEILRPSGAVGMLRLDGDLEASLLRVDHLWLQLAAAWPAIRSLPFRAGTCS
jgi:hypothetical protein